MKKGATRAPFHCAPSRGSDGLCRLGCAQADMQLAQLFLVHGTRRLGQEALRTLGLGEGDHVADALRTGEQHGDAIHTESDTTVRRRTEAQCGEQEAKLFLGLFILDAERGETLPRERPGFAPVVNESVVNGDAVATVVYYGERPGRL